MARTTAVLVSQIIEVESGLDLTPFINAANTLVTNACASDTGYTAADLQQIETWLAAHFYAIYDPRAKTEKAGSVSQTIESKIELGLNVTRYGQMAMRLDWKGYLAALDNRITKGKKKAATITWLGTEEDNATEPGDD